MHPEQHITPRHLEHLLEVSNQTTPVVSLILSMAVKGPETRKNAIELKSALKEARQTLEDGETDPSRIEAMLAPAEALLEDEDFWQHQESTLALYLAPEVFCPFKLATSHSRHVAVGARFQLRPLLQTLSRLDHAYVLSLSQHRVELYEFRRGVLTEQTVPNLPKDLESALLLDPEQSLQGHTVTRSAQGGPVRGAHGHGGAKDERLGHLRDFLTQVEKAVSRFLDRHPAPLFLATVEENEALYRKISDSEYLASQAVRGSFEHQSIDALLEAFKPVLADYAEETARSLASQVSAAVAQGEGTTDLREAVVAANEGRVRSCLVAADAASHFGAWNSATREVRTDPDQVELSSDLLDLMAADAWKKGAELCFADRELLPEKADFAVSFRYSY